MALRRRRLFPGADRFRNSSFQPVARTLCALNTSASTVSGSGAKLTVDASVVFKSTVARNIYMRADNLAGADTGWTLRGTWNKTAPALGMMLVSPSSSSGGSQTSTLTYPDPPGFAGAAFGWEQFLIAAATDGAGLPSCFVQYDRGGNGLRMYSSDVGFFLGPVAPGTTSSALNSGACSINTAGATVMNSSGNLVVTVPVTMKAPMSGRKEDVPANASKASRSDRYVWVSSKPPRFSVLARVLSAPAVKFRANGIAGTSYLTS